LRLSGVFIDKKVNHADKAGVYTLQNAK
jgi:hypothetical protein